MNYDILDLEHDISIPIILVDNIIYDIIDMISTMIS